MQQEHTSLLDQVHREHEGDNSTDQSGRSFLGSLTVLSIHKRLIAWTTSTLTAVAAVALAFVHDSFRAQSVIMPPQQQQSSLSAFAQGPLGSLATSGLASQLGLKNPADLYIGILKSRTVSDAVIRHFDLKKVYGRTLLSEARLDFSNRVTFSSGKDSLIAISVEDREPGRAAAIANALVEELYKQNSRLAMTEASQRRLFFEQRLSVEKDALSYAESELQKVQSSTGLLLPSGQAEVLLRSTAQLRAQISSREVVLEATRSYATDESVQVKNLERELNVLRLQLTALENKATRGSTFELSVGQLPAASLAYVHKLRDVKYHELLYELLAKQFESAQLDEAKQAPLLQVIDRATLPDKKSGPQRIQLVLAAGLVILVLTCASVLISHNLNIRITRDSNRAKAFSLFSSL